MKEKIYQMFILGTGDLDKPLQDGLGGVIFFTKDISTREQFKCLVERLKGLAKIPPFLSIDQEGGRVERTENIHERFLSPMLAYKKGGEFLSTQNDKMLSELIEYGINMNFAPCLDVNTNSNNPIIGERAFGVNPNDVCNGYDIVSPVYKKHNIIPVIKHFPGHGDASKDSHKELPQITLSLKEMEEVHIAPFNHAIKCGIDAIMVAHLHCTCFNKEALPSSLSKNCLSYLRDKLKYDGLIISDDMFMKGVAKYGMTEACIMGIKAGVNMFIYYESNKKTLEVMDNIIKISKEDKILKENIEKSYKKIMSIKRKYGLIKQ